MWKETRHYKDLLLMSPLRNVWTLLGSREELTEYLSELSS